MSSQEDVDSNEAQRLAAVSKTGLTNAPDETMDRLAGLVARLLGASVGLVSLVDGTRQFFPGQVGLGDPLSDVRQTPLIQSVCREVVASADLVQIDHAATDLRWQAHAAHTELGIESYLGAPLLDADGRVLGSLCALETTPRTWTADERQTLVDLAFGASSELRARIAVTEANEARADAEAARAATELARSRVELMADVSTALISTMNPDLAIERMLTVLVGRFANWAIALTKADENTSARIFARHRDPGSNMLFAEIGQDPVRRLEHMNMTRAVLESDVDRVLLTHEQTAAAIDQAGPLRELLIKLGVGATVIVPMRVAGQTIGVLVLVSHPGQPAYDAVDVRLAGDLARRAAMTIDHSRGYLRAETVAFELQHSLLPDLPSTTRIGVDAVYAAAAQGVDVGGDWYDLVELAAGTFVVSIGDVTGHSIRAAAAMGRLQVAVRIFALADHSPSEILERVDTAADGLLADLLATCLVIRLDPLPDGRWSLTIANAGHLPPVLLTAEGTSTALDIPPDPLLGLGSQRREPRHTTTTMIEPGSTLVLCTDGLIEHRGETLDVGLERLRINVGHAGGDLAEGGSADGSIDGFCDRLVRLMKPSRTDDIACIALRV